MAVGALHRGRGALPCLGSGRQSADEPAGEPAGRSRGQPSQAAASRLFSEGNRLRRGKQLAAALLKTRRPTGSSPATRSARHGADLARHGPLGGIRGLPRALHPRGTDQSPPESSRRRDRLDDLKRRLARVWISCPVAGPASPSTAGSWGSRRGALDLPGAGQHKLLLTLKGYRPAVRSLTLRAGELRDLPLDLRILEARAHELPPALKQAAPPSPPPPSPEALEQTRRTRTIWGFTTLAVGVAALSGAAVLYFIGLSRATRPTRDYYDATSAYRHRARARSTASTAKGGCPGQARRRSVLVGAAAAALGSGLPAADPPGGAARAVQRLGDPLAGRRRGRGDGGLLMSSRRHPLRLAVLLDDPGAGGRRLRLVAQRGPLRSSPLSRRLPTGAGLL